jgi:hypothetical protein
MKKSVFLAIQEAIQEEKRDKQKQEPRGFVPRGLIL